MSVLSKVALDSGGGDAFWRRTLNPYELHQGLWELFPADTGAPRTFLFRHDRTPSGLIAYTVSDQPPVKNHTHWRVLGSKKYAPLLRQGQRLAFTLRANATVKRHDISGRPMRCDVVMDAKFRRADPSIQSVVAPAIADTESDGSASLAQEYGMAWLMARGQRLGCTFEGESIRVDGYRQHEHRRRGQRIRFSTLDFNGVLRVDDPDMLSTSLIRGIGPSKAFGCGLMLIKSA